MAENDSPSTRNTIVMISGNPLVNMNAPAVPRIVINRIGLKNSERKTFNIKRVRSFKHWKRLRCGSMEQVAIQCGGTT